jgi:hypothetical protein
MEGIMNLIQVSDDTILQEYVRRFTIKGGIPIESATEAANFFRSYFADASKQERFLVCFMNGQHQVLATEIMFQGSLTTSAVYPREVISRVLDLGAVTKPSLKNCKLPWQPSMFHFSIILSSLARSIFRLLIHTCFNNHKKRSQP